MLNKSREELDQLGATITAREIEQQPILWDETFSVYQERRDVINKYLQMIADNHERIQVIFTGAGTSAYVGETVAPFVKERMDKKKWTVDSIPTTSIVSNPYQYLDEETPTLLVSIDRSGNSPESLAAVGLAKQIVEDLYQLTITCSIDGKLAEAVEGDDKNYLVLMPKKSNDRGFAMTGSYTCMTLAALLIFGNLDEETEGRLVAQAIDLAVSTLDRTDQIEALLSQDYKRIIYLGSGSLEALSKEAQLKVLELTAGEIATAYGSSLGFRHGLRSFVDETALVFLFVSNNPYTRQYDVDMLNELQAAGMAQKVVALQVEGENTFGGDSFTYDKEGAFLPDAFLALPYVVFVQLVSLISSVKYGHKPDDPFRIGTVNRVSKGTTIHEYQK